MIGPMLSVFRRCCTKRAVVGAILLGIVGILCIQLPGCSVMKTMVRGDVNEPELIFGSPDSTGCVIIRCQVRFDPPHHGNPLKLGSFVTGAVANAIEGEQDVWRIYSGSLVDQNGNRSPGLFREMNWTGSRRLLLFGDIGAGNYRLDQISVVYRYQYEKGDYSPELDDWVDTSTTIYDTCLINVPSNAFEDLALEVSPGEVVYAGSLIILDDRENQENNQYLIVNNPMEELQAYEDLLKRYKESPWAGKWRARIEELKGPTP